MLQLQYSCACISPTSFNLGSSLYWWEDVPIWLDALIRADSDAYLVISNEILKPFNKTKKTPTTSMADLT